MWTSHEKEVVSQLKLKMSPSSSTSICHGSSIPSPRSKCLYHPQLFFVILSVSAKIYTVSQHSLACIKNKYYLFSFVQVQASRLQWRFNLTAATDWPMDLHHQRWLAARNHTVLVLVARESTQLPVVYAWRMSQEPKGEELCQVLLNM